MPSYLVTAVIEVDGCYDVADYIAGIISHGLCSGDNLGTLWAREMTEEDCDCEDRGWYGDGHDSECPLTYAKGEN